jgi:hypothetical protein
VNAPLLLSLALNFELASTVEDAHREDKHPDRRLSARKTRLSWILLGVESAKTRRSSLLQLTIEEPRRRLYTPLGVT